MDGKIEFLTEPNEQKSVIDYATPQRAGKKGLHSAIGGIALAPVALLLLITDTSLPPTREAMVSGLIAGIGLLLSLDSLQAGRGRRACYGRCPVYSAILRADGTVRYEGKMYVQRLGIHTGTVPRESFQEVAKLVLDNGFMNLRDGYSKPVTDNPTVITTVVVGRQKKVVRNYARAGPKELEKIEHRIDSLMDHTQWDQDHSPNR